MLRFINAESAQHLAKMSQKLDHNTTVLVTMKIFSLGLLTNSKLNLSFRKLKIETGLFQIEYNMDTGAQASVLPLSMYNQLNINLN